jgi:hypothetical protein
VIRVVAVTGLQLLGKTNKYSRYRENAPWRHRPSQPSPSATAL